MAVRIGSARSSYGNTAPGDQNGGKEVSTENWYLHSKGWIVLRAIDPTQRELIAVAMERACDNNDIGYSQPTRNTLYDNVKSCGFDPARTSKKVNTDCSALVRVCVNYAGIKAGNFITSSEVRVLMATGAFMQFTDDAHCKSSARLLRGDILVTRSKGHTVAVLSDGAKAAEEKQSMPAEYALGDRLLKNGCVGADVKQLQEALIRLGISCGDYGADGEFGDCTEMAVIAYQKQHALEADGEYGPLTHASLTAELERLENPAQENCVRIVGGNCYVRIEPNTDAEKLGVAHRDTLLPYQGETAANVWLKVSFAGRDGWVSGKYGRICG